MPEISRRGLLKLLGSTALVLQASPTSFFDMGPSVALGAARGYNSFLSIDWIAREALKVLTNNLTFPKHVNRDFDSWSAMEGHSFKRGDIISIGGRFQVNPDLSIQDPPRDLVDIVGMKPIEDANQALADAIDDQRLFTDGEISKAAQSVADEIDRRGLELMNERIRDRGWRGMVDLMKRRA